LGAHSRWESEVSDDVSKSLSRRVSISIHTNASNGICGGPMLLMSCIPLCLVLRENLSLRVVANDLDVDKTTQVQLFRSKHGHLDRL
jgi:hypothetical protein